jgi:hypothetical protein
MYIRGFFVHSFDCGRLIFAIVQLFIRELVTSTQ